MQCQGKPKTEAPKHRDFCIISIFQVLHHAKNKSIPVPNDTGMLEKSALAELRRTTGSLRDRTSCAPSYEDLGSGSQPSSAHRAELRIYLAAEHGTDAVTDRTSLAGEAAAMNVNLNIELIGSLGQQPGADVLRRLQSLQTKVLIDVTLVDGDLTGHRRTRWTRATALLPSAGCTIISLLAILVLPPFTPY